MSDVNGKGGTFLALIARFCTESAKAAYGTNTGIICVCGHVTGKGAPASQFCRGKKREIQTKLGENGAKQY